MLVRGFQFMTANSPMTSQTFVTVTISLSMSVSTICMKYVKQWRMLVKIFRIMYEKMKMSSFLDLTFDYGYRKSAPY
jgi:hypothetical protein